MISVQELIGNCFYISLCRSAEASFKICLLYILPREDITYDAYMQELNAIVLYVVIFVPSQFLFPTRVLW